MPGRERSQAQKCPAGAPRTLPGQPAAPTCPRRIRQPLDSSPKPPLEKFPNFSAALHALTPGRSEESQEEETAPAQTPGAAVHPRRSGRAFPAVVPTLPGALRRLRRRRMRGRGWRGFAAQTASGRPRTDRSFTRASPALSSDAPRLGRWTSPAQHRRGPPWTGAGWRWASRARAVKSRRAGEHPAPAAGAAAAVGSARSR